MQIERKGSGPWPKVYVDGVVVTLEVADDRLSYDCAALQRNMQVIIDVVMDYDGHLAEGVANGSDYVANLIIPPARYADVDLPMIMEDEPLPEGLDPACIMEPPKVETVAIPLESDDMEAVRLILWTINENTNYQETF